MSHRGWMGVCNLVIIVCSVMCLVTGDSDHLLCAALCVIMRNQFDILDKSENK
jgi:hypothetical protein